MFLLPGPAGNVDLKDSRMKGLFIRGQSSAFEGRMKNGLCCIMLQQIKILLRTSLRPRNFLEPGIISCGQ